MWGAPARSCAVSEIREDSSGLTTQNQHTVPMHQFNSSTTRVWLTAHHSRDRRQSKPACLFRLSHPFPFWVLPLLPLAPRTLFLILPFFLLSLPLLKGIHPVYNVCDKTLTKMNLGRKGFDLPYVLQSIIKGSQSRNSRQEPGGGK